MVEVLTGILSGSNYATHIRKWTLDSDPMVDGANLGQVFIAVAPDCFAPGFEDRMSDMNGILRNLPPVDEKKPVLVPGDPESAHMKKVDKDGGIQYHINQLKACDEWADKLNIPRLGSL